MRTLRVVGGLLLVLCLSMAASGSWLPAQETSSFHPEVGQAGKDVVWVPTPQELVDKMLDLAQVTPQDYLVDLGSGDGRTVIAAAKRGAHALGIEYNPDMVELSRANAAKEGLNGKAEFLQGDLFETDFSQATVVTMFLLPSINVQLRPKLLEMKPGTRVVSNSFTMGDWAADETATIDECHSWCTALFWIVPAKVEGNWRLDEGELSLTQTFQNLSGTLSTHGENIEISDAKMHGDQITFSAGNTVYTGHVNGSVIEGTAAVANGRNVAWKATRAAKQAPGQ